MLTAWGDESGSRPDLDPGTYLLAAALLDENDVSAARDAMESLRIEEPKVHWHGSSETRRIELVEAVIGLPVAAIVVVHHDTDATDRRHRRKCLEHLLPHLADVPCSKITFESRSSLDASDLATMQLLRNRRAISNTLRIAHAVGRLEPVLWISDIICGAVVQSRIGQSRYLDLLGGSVDLHEI
ncbi:hypothetical protein [Tsukamurella spumae]|uniref:DUF3800 domain-containing protein n=1 Tax=Tsukamurella spumae TaxID=44753 RepID=A0A846X3E5_9ACTN|nr:hypothetical protein [Tsukamurella spumae]NKY20028.1 hypothetical protein [Tsukamurella spumae]